MPIGLFHTGPSLARGASGLGSTNVRSEMPQILSIRPDAFGQADNPGLDGPQSNSSLLVFRTPRQRYQGSPLRRLGKKFGALRFGRHLFVPRVSVQFIIEGHC